ncbi:MAG: Threonylcarbamoyl-AMP synthase / SUA5 domain with internal deletion [uncultured Truepera sp.]|uniref:Threonylcarbamoyl-AMP synthase n=1 Tax=uncultured Truepera sp. TaxID=543023 RepID=A0A6J4V2R5_9DEIN|nr:MAG: Threonylcarbamoyl-AMP synthase / SUA5 domain with internal deletion [uncultured Truepera sp.]
MKPEPTDLERAADLLQGGGLVAFPTETVYGLGADARNEAAVRRVFALKGRPADHPLIVHLASAEQLVEWAVDIPEVVYALAACFWPGPLTLILKRQGNVPDAVTGGQATVGLRVPGHPVALALLERFGGGVAAPSANRFGRVSPTTAAHVREEFGSQLEVVDGGPCSVGLESTILDLSGDAPKVLRPGAVSAAELETVLHRPVGVATVTSPRVSGSLKSHYAPETETWLVDDASAHSLETDAVLARRLQASAAARWLTLPGDPDGYGQGLYAALRDLDASGCARILIERPPNTPAWSAVRDRLVRAALPLSEMSSVEKISV